MGDHLRADLSRITQASRLMKVLSNEFANISHVADVGGAAGDAGLASALSDFAANWSDMRNQLIGQLRDLATIADRAVHEYRSTDDTLGRKLASAEKPHPGQRG